MQKENGSFKEEQRFAKNCTKALEHILSAQISYYNEPGLDFEKESAMKNDFPNGKKRQRHRPSSHFYENYYGK